MNLKELKEEDIGGSGTKESRVGTMQLLYQEINQRRKGGVYVMDKQCYRLLKPPHGLETTREKRVMVMGKVSFQLLRLVGASQLKLEEAAVLGRVLDAPDDTV